jgi:hypothetical protein
MKTLFETISNNFCGNIIVEHPEVDRNQRKGIKKMNMANICDCTYKITGHNEAIMNLYNAIRENDDKQSNVYLYKLAEHYGVDYEKKKISVRGSIYFYELDESNNPEYPVLTIKTETAWTACTLLFNSINLKLNNELSISYREIEVGCCVFYTHDEGEWFPEQVIVSSSGEPFDDVCEDAYMTFDDAINEWCDKMKFNRDGRSTNEMLELIDEYEYDDMDTYFNIYTITFE